MVFELQPYLAARRELINAELDRILPAEEVPPERLHGAIRYCVLSGGKRLRPILCLAAAEAAGGTREPALLPALAVELLHTYTLIHDDLPAMDDDDMRRGKPSCHAAFDEATAILAGDALQAMAFELLGRAEMTARWPVGMLVFELAHASGSRGVVGGQAEDIAALSDNPDRDRLEFIHLHKTADLFRATVRMGAITARSNAHCLQALTSYAVNLGLAFQIVDDILDGLPTDPRRKETSCLQLYSADQALDKAAALMEEALRALGKLDTEKAQPLAAIGDFVLQRARAPS